MFFNESFNLFILLIAGLTFTAEVIFYTLLATVFTQDCLCETSTALTGILIFPQRKQVYVACRLISVIVTIFT